MRLLSIDNIKEDMYLAKSVYSADGMVLLAEGMKLNDYYIQCLRRLGISMLYIADSRIGRLKIDELIHSRLKSEAVKVAKKVITNVSNGQDINSEEVCQVVNSLMDELIANRTIICNLVEIRTIEDFRFTHSVAVCILSIMTGIALGYNYHKLKQLGVAAILHDIGNTKIPMEILNKKDKLSTEEFEIVKTHAQVGYDLLRKYNDISSVSAHAVLQHHERIDGSGYPQRLKNKDIHEFAKIIALADVYDALSSDRCYRKRLLPHEVIEYIRDKSTTEFDTDIAEVFLQNIAPYPIGSMVELNNGESGVVTEIAKPFPARPVVKVLSKDGSLLAEPIERDLKRDLTCVITGVCIGANG